MAKLLRLESLEDPPRSIIETDSGKISIGREIDNHVILDSDAISRNHCYLFEAEGHWFIRDLGSTNGSSVNGVRLNLDQLYPLRHEDVISLANFPMRVISQGLGTNFTSTTVLLFNGESFFNSYELENLDNRFIMGGTDGLVDLGDPNIRLEVVKERNGGLQLYCQTPPQTIALNGELIGETSPLSDRDQVALGNLNIIICDSATLQTAAQSEFEAADPGQYDVQSTEDAEGGAGGIRITGIRDWDNESSTASDKMGKKNFVFGSAPQEEEDEALATLNIDDSSGFQMSSRRFSQVGLPTAEKESSPMTELFLFCLGVITFCILLVVIVYAIQVFADI